MIATTISAHNRCDYCVSHHSEALRFYLKNGEQLGAFREGQVPDSVDERSRLLVDYALKLSLQPSAVTKNDVENLRKTGISDAEILDLVLLTAYMNYVNRVAQGLGVEHDEQEARGYKY